ncbi:MAG TPA: hypothetical protein VGB02_18255 [Pyrinomonadaceae bacterium]
MNQIRNCNFVFMGCLFKTRGKVPGVMHRTRFYAYWTSSNRAALFCPCLFGAFWRIVFFRDGAKVFQEIRSLLRLREKSVITRLNFERAARRYVLREQSGFFVVAALNLGFRSLVNVKF